MVSVLAFLLYLSFKDQLSPYYFQEYETVKEHAAVSTWPIVCINVYTSLHIKYMCECM